MSFTEDLADLVRKSLPETASAAVSDRLQLCSELEEEKNQWQENADHWKKQYQDIKSKDRSYDDLAARESQLQSDIEKLKQDRRSFEFECDLEQRRLEFEIRMSQTAVTVEQSRRSHLEELLKSISKGIANGGVLCSARQCDGS